MRRYRNTKTQNKSFFVICALIAILIIINVVINVSLRPVICKMAEKYGSNEIYSVIDDTVYDVISNSNVDYSGIVSLGYNDIGFVTSCEYDYAQINQIKLDCSRELLDRLEKLSSTKIKIPLGSVFGDLNAQGRGAKIRVKLQSVSVPIVEVISLFESCGINQTRHEIRLKISVDAQVYLPPNESEFTCMQEFVLAQTIIVGDIPSGYAVLG